MFIKSKIPQIIYEPLAPFISKWARKNQTRSRNSKTQKEERSPSQKGQDAHKADMIQEQEKQRDVMDQLIKKSNRLIMSISSFTLIPFNPFVNRIDVEESRVTFLFRQPFTFQSHSVDIADISNVFIESAFLFAEMQVVSRTFIQNNITIGHLNKNEANKMRRVIEGLRTFSKAKIDTSVYEIDELIQKIDELHTTNRETS